MTVTYTAEVSTAGPLGNFPKLLFRWRGGIYKLVYCDLIVFLVLYYMLHGVYSFLDKDRQKVFEAVVHFCATYGSLIPLSFVLGFFCSLVMARWWDQYKTIPWPDTLAVLVSAHIQGEDERARVMRRTVMRYACLCLTMVFTMICRRVKKRFPNHAALTEAGLMAESERRIMESLDEVYPIANYPKHWMPIVWAASIVTRARREGKIRDDYAVKSIIDELNRLRGRCGFLLYYDWICVPLIYTQMVALAVYAYFLCNIIGSQIPNDPLSPNYANSAEATFPFFTALHFFFYMGWLKVAESLINPFGDDDDDFEINWMIDRNLLISYLIVDGMHQEHPELIKDQYWDEVFPNTLPYANEADRAEPPEASTAKMDQPKQTFLQHIRSATSFHKMDKNDERRSTRKSQLGISYKDEGTRSSRKSENRSSSSGALTQEDHFWRPGYISTKDDEELEDDEIIKSETYVQPEVSKKDAMEKDEIEREEIEKEEIEKDLEEEGEEEEEEEEEETYRPITGEPTLITPDPDALGFEELMAMRQLEREERTRNRFLNLRSMETHQHTRYMVTSEPRSYEDQGEEENQ